MTDDDTEVDITTSALNTYAHAEISVVTPPLTHDRFPTTALTLMHCPNRAISKRAMKADLGSILLEGRKEDGCVQAAME